MPRVTELPASSGLVAADLFPVVDDVAGTPVTQRATIAQLRDFFMPGNANNGRDFALPRLGNTGTRAQQRDALITFGSAEFAGNAFADPVCGFGYNFNFGTVVADSAGAEKWAIGVMFEGDYVVDTTQGGTSTGGTATTITQSGKTWGVNRWRGHTLHNVTTGGRAQIVSNTADTLTISGSMVLADGVSAAAANATGQTYQILRRDVECYFATGFKPAGPYQGVRPYIFVLDRAFAEAQATPPVIQAATNAADAVFTTASDHGLGVGDYVKFEALAGGTWGTELNQRTRIVTAVPASNQFRVGVNSTGFGTYTASSGTAYAEPRAAADSVSGFNAGHTWSFASFRAGGVPSGQTYQDNLGMRLAPGNLDLYPAANVNCNLNVRAGLNGTAQLLLEYNRIPTVFAASNFTSNFSLQIANASGASAAQALGAFRNNTENWGGIVIGANGGITTALMVVDGISLATTRPMHRARQQATPTAAAHTFAVYASDNTALQYFIDGVGNWVTKATTNADTDTNGFLYVPLVAGTAAGGTPANLTGNYANAAPVRFVNNAGVYSLRAYINGGWRQVALT